MILKKRLDWPGAVDARGLVIFARNILQAAEKDQHVEAHEKPDADDDDGEEREARIAEPGDRAEIERGRRTG